MLVPQIPDPHCNLWIEFPILGTITKFRVFREKVGDDIKSSNILKSIFYIWDVKSKYRKANMSEKEIEKEMKTNILKNGNFSWKKYVGIKVYFLDKNQSKIQKLFTETERHIRELNHFLSEEWVWSPETAKDKAAVMKQYKSLYEDYLNLKEQIDEEEQAYESGRGGYSKSLLERQ